MKQTTRLKKLADKLVEKKKKKDKKDDTIEAPVKKAKKFKKLKLTKSMITENPIAPAEPADTKEDPLAPYLKLNGEPAAKIRKRAHSKA